jgi:hypothetical protein
MLAKLGIANCKEESLSRHFTVVEIVKKFTDSFRNPLTPVYL